MKTSVSCSVVAMAVFFAAGCSMVGPRTEGSMPAIYPLGGKPLVPRAPSTPGVNCRAGGAANTCTIQVKVTDSNCDPANIVLDDYVLLPDIREKDKVVWKLDAGYVFCQRAGDGVFLKDPNVPDDLVDPVHKSRCSDEFEWKRKRADGQDLEYLLRFRSANRTCVKDPWMRN